MKSERRYIAKGTRDPGVWCLLHLISIFEIWTKSKRNHFCRTPTRSDHDNYKYEDEDKDKDEDAKTIPGTLTVCYIFGILMTRPVQPSTAQNSLARCSNVFKLVQNLFKRVQNCSKLVQMCSKLFKNYQPFQCKGSDMTSRA